MKTLLTPALVWLSLAAVQATPLLQPRDFSNAVEQRSAQDTSSMRQQNAQNTEDIELCNYYEDHYWKGRDSTNKCTEWCKSTGQFKEDDGTSAILGAAQCKFAGDPNKKKDNDGDLYQVGYCTCRDDTLEAVGEIFIEGLIAVGEWLDKAINEIGCSLFLDTLNIVLEVATTAIPGVGQLNAASKGMRVAVNLARNVERNGGNAMDLIGMIPTDSICKTEKDYGPVADDVYLPLLGKKKPGQKPGGAPKKNDPPKSQPAPQPSNNPQPSSRPANNPSSSKQETSQAQSTAQSTVRSQTASNNPSSSVQASSQAQSTGQSQTASKTDQSSATTSSSPTASSRSSSASNGSSTPSSSGTSSASSSSPTPSSSGTSSNSASTTTSSTSTSSDDACTRSTARPSNRPRGIQKRATESDYKRCDNPKGMPRTQKEIDEIIDLLQKYDNSQADMDRATSYIIKRYMTDVNPKKDHAVFYIRSASSERAQKLKNERGKVTIESVFYGYGQGCFNNALEPGKTIVKKNLLGNWFRATSRAFARQVSGEVYLVYDEQDPFTALSGDPKFRSIFNTDELPEMEKKESQVTHIYQMGTGCAERWTPGDPSQLIPFPVDVSSWSPSCPINGDDKNLPVRQIYSKTGGREKMP